MPFRTDAVHAQELAAHVEARHLVTAVFQDLRRLEAPASYRIERHEHVACAVHALAALDAPARVHQLVRTLGVAAGQPVGQALVAQRAVRATRGNGGDRGPGSDRRAETTLPRGECEDRGGGSHVVLLQCLKGPAMMSRTAVVCVFSKKWSAPASMQVRRYWGLSNWVRTMNRVPGTRVRTRRSTSSPVPPISWMSSRTQSGRERRMPSTASCGLSASPTTETPSISPTRAASRSRTTRESSTMKTLRGGMIFSMPPSMKIGGGARHRRGLIRRVGGR